MEQYISKSTIIAEIENIESSAICEYKSQPSRYSEGCLDSIHRIKSFINALEPKEVDLEKEIDNVWNPHFNLGWDEKSLLSMNHEGFTTIAEHFFELGMSVNIKAQKGE